MDEFALGFCGSTQADADEAALFKGFYVGGVLQCLLLAAGMSKDETCNCQCQINDMNGWGPAGCRERIGQIADGLQTEAKERGIATWRPAVVTLVRCAIELSEELGDKYCTVPMAFDWCKRKSAVIAEWLGKESGLGSIAAGLIVKSALRMQPYNDYFSKLPTSTKSLLKSFL